MKDEIVRIIETHWQAAMPKLLGVLGEARDELDTLLAGPAGRRRTVEADREQLGRALGGFGSEALDPEALSSILHQGDATEHETQQRSQRLHRLDQSLASTLHRLEREPPRPMVCDLADGHEPLLERFEAHVTPVCAALRLVRQVRLEARGRYDPGEHDPLFSRFDWRQLDSQEIALCPPFVIIATPPAGSGSQLATLMQLLTSGRPVKLVMLHQAWHPERAETGRAAAVHGMDDLTLLFVALRSVFWVQTSPASLTPMAVRVTEGLASPRPALLSVFAHGGDPAEVARRATAALASRGFPHLRYDPDQSPDFVSCLDLSDNPDPAAQWVTQPLTFVGEDGERNQMERPFTFADYGCDEAELRGQFTPLRPDEEAHALPLAAYLDLEPSQRRHRVPFVFSRDSGGNLERLVPSQAILAFTSDRMQLWTTLQELGGIGNPHVLAAERRLREQLTAEKDAALGEQQARLEAEFRTRQQTQLADAIRTLLARLIGPTEPATGTAGALSTAMPASQTNSTARAPAPSETAPEPRNGTERDNP